MQFDHVGVATDDAHAVASVYSDLFDTPVVHEEEKRGMKILFLELGEGYFELLEPGEDGQIREYLDENGPGIHHVAARTDDIEAALQNARDAGVELIDEEPRPGAWDHEIAFLDPASTGGILVEFVQV